MIVTWHEREAFGKALVVIISVLTVPGVLCQLHLKNKQTNKNPNQTKQTKALAVIIILSILLLNTCFSLTLQAMRIQSPEGPQSCLSRSGFFPLVSFRVEETGVLQGSSYCWIQRSDWGDSQDAGWAQGQD